MTDDRPLRAVDDPVTLARAARIVRIALARGRLALAELDGGNGTARQQGGAQVPADAAAS